MVSIKVKSGKEFFVCDTCGLIYKDKKTAEKCQTWCENNPGSCNPNVIQLSVELENE